MQLRVWSFLGRQRERGATVFFSSHILSSEVQKICRRVAIIRDGSIVRIEDIGTLQKEHLKKVSMTFQHGFSLDSIDVPGGHGDEAGREIPCGSSNPERRTYCSSTW